MLIIRASHLVIAGLALLAANVLAFNLHEPPHEIPAVRSVSLDAATEARLRRIEAALSAVAAERADAALGSDHVGSNHVVQQRELAALQSPITGNAVSGGLDPSSPEDIAESEDAQLAARASFLDATFMAERADPTWSMVAAESVSRDLPSNALQNNQVSDVACQSSLCRIQATHTDINAEQTFLMELGNLHAFRNGEAFLVTTSRQDGSLATTIYVSRSGQNLPAAEI